MQSMDNQPLTMADAARYCNMGYENLRYYIKKERGPIFEVKGKRSKFFWIKDLDAWERYDRRHDNTGKKKEKPND